MPRNHVPTYDPDLPPLDLTGIAARAAREVTKELTGLTGGARLVAAQEIAAAAQEHAQTLAAEKTPLLERLALSAYFYEHITGVPEAAGFSEDRWARLRSAALNLDSGERLPHIYHSGADNTPHAIGRAVRAAKAAQAVAEAAGVEQIPGAAAQLSALAEELAFADARAGAALAESSSSPRARLAPLDTDTIVDQESTRVARQMKPLLKDPEGRYRAACDIITKARRSIAELQPERNKLVASAYFYDHVQAVDKAAGIFQQESLTIRRAALGLGPDDTVPRVTKDNRAEITKLALQAKVKYIHNAPSKLPAVAEAYTRARARAEAALPFRDSAMTELWGRPGWTRAKLAEIANIDPSQVRRLTSN